ncbi:DUF4158 domain-containing protein [Streptomyces hygroscopicus subsp. hygroscopicus]|nr:DUF4158 domain-containing protein [Streptomyces hygroscopicus subsp. hygroscopicus]
MVGHRALGAQLQIEDASVVKWYTEWAKTAYEHAWEIRDAYGYHPFEDAEWGRKFRAFLHGRAWTGAEGPVALFAARGRGGPRRVPGVRAGAAVPRTEPARRVRLAVEPVGGPSGAAAGRQAVGGRLRGRTARPDPGQAGRGTPGRAGAGPGRGLAA